MKLKPLSIVAVFLVLAFAASASPIGTLSFGQAGGGGVVVSATRVDWYFPLSDLIGAPSTTIINGGGNIFPNNVNPGPGNPPNNGAITAGGGTAITYDGGIFNTGAGFVMDLDVTVPANAPPVTNFIMLTGTDLTFDLNSFTPPPVGPSTLAGCSAAGIGQACRPLLTYGPFSGPGNSFLSPVVLTTNADGSVSVSLTVSLTAHDLSGSTPWSGTFTTQVPNVPGLGSAAAIEAQINVGNAINDTYSGGFSGFATVPEPATGALIGGALIGLAALLRRRRKA